MKTRNFYYENDPDRVFEFSNALKRKFDFFEFVPNHYEFIFKSNTAKKIYIYLGYNKIYFAQEPFIYTSVEDFIKISQPTLREILIYNLDLFMKPVYIN